MDDGEKEIVGLMKEWKDEIKGIVSDYKTAIETLNQNNKKWFVVYRPFIVGGISFALIVIAFIITSKTTQWCELSISFSSGISASSECR